MTRNEQPDQERGVEQSSPNTQPGQDKPQKNQIVPAASTTTHSSPKKTPKQPPVKELPPWKVLLHNDDVNEQLHVVESILLLTHLNKQEALQRMLEAHDKGTSLLLTTHRERAELYKDQFASRNLTITIEPVEG